MGLFSVVESVGPLILAPYLGAKGRRVPACPWREPASRGQAGVPLQAPCWMWWLPL